MRLPPKAFAEAKRPVIVTADSVAVCCHSPLCTGGVGLGPAASASTPTFLCIVRYGGQRSPLRARTPAPPTQIETLASFVESRQRETVGLGTISAESTTTTRAKPSPPASSPTVARCPPAWPAPRKRSGAADRLLSSSSRPRRRRARSGRLRCRRAGAGPFRWCWGS